MKQVLVYLLALAMMACPVMAANTAKAQSKPEAAEPPPFVVVSFVITLENAQRCSQGGGCDVYHLDDIEALFGETIKKARAEGRAEGCMGT